MIALTMLMPVFVFQGGNDAALAQKIAEWVQSPVAFLADREAHWTKAEIRAEDEKDRRRLLRTKLGLDVPAASWGLAAAPWSRRYLNYIYRPANLADATRGFKPLAEVSQNGRITFVTDKIPAPLDRALNVIGKETEIDWNYKFVAVHIHAREVKERLYLQTLADAVGARLEESPSKYRLAFDPKAYRRRTAALIRSEMNSLPEGWTRAQLQFDLAVIQALSDRQLAVFMDEDNLSKDMWFPATSDVLAASANRLKWILGNGQTPARSVSDERLARRFGGVVDFTRPTGIAWNPSGSAAARYRGEKDGRPINVVP